MVNNKKAQRNTDNSILTIILIVVVFFGVLVIADEGITTDPQTQEAFVSTWETYETGETDSNQVMLPLVETGEYNFQVFWGDGTNDTITTWNQSEVTHNYTNSGRYDITIEGNITGFSFDDAQSQGGDRTKITEISSWGNLKLEDNSSVGAFEGTTNLDVISAETGLNLADSTNLTAIFSGSGVLSFDETGLALWDLTNVTSLEQAFMNTPNFNTDISEWDVSNVENTKDMFYGAEIFNQDINSWDVSSVTNMENMFRNADAFNQDLNTWDTSSVTNMANIFAETTSFNSDITTWNTSSVTNMAGMFSSTTSFNQDLSSWDVSNVESMNAMFKGSQSFNQDLPNWNVGNVGDFQEMFMNTALFDGDLSNWTIVNQEAEDFDRSMGRMFKGAESFGNEAGSTSQLNWNLSQIEIVDEMYMDTDSFKGNLSNWDTSDVLSADSMFQNTLVFEPDMHGVISGWDFTNIQQVAGPSNTVEDNQYADFGGAYGIGGCAEFGENNIAFEFTTLPQGMTFSGGEYSCN